MSLNIGDNAPDFSLKTKNADGLKDISLVIIKINSRLFYYSSLFFTSVCTEETCSVRDDISSYSDLNAQVYGISVDSPFAQEIMAQRENLNFPLLSDFNKDVSKAYGVLYEDFIGFAGVSKKVGFCSFKRGSHLTFMVFR